MKFLAVVEGEPFAQVSLQMLAGDACLSGIWVTGFIYS